MSADGGSQARWRRDGSEIFYLAPDRHVIAASVTTHGGEFIVNGYDPLFEIRHPYGAYHAFDVTEDGEALPREHARRQSRRRDGRRAS